MSMITHFTKQTETAVVQRLVFDDINTLQNFEGYNPQQDNFKMHQ